MWAKYKRLYGQPGEKDSKLATRTHFWEKYRALSTTNAHPADIERKQKAGLPLTEGEKMQVREQSGKKLGKRQQRAKDMANALLVELGWKPADDNSAPGNTPGKNKGGKR